MRLSLVLLSFAASVAFAQQQAAQLTEELGKTVLYHDVALSPDARTLAWTQGTAAAEGTILYRMERRPGAKPERVKMAESDAEDKRRDSAPAFSPDGRTIAFFSTADSTGDQRQLWLVPATGKASAQKRTSLNGYAERPRWSPDGKSIAFLYVESAGGGGPLAAAPEQTGVIDTNFHNQRLAIFDVGSGKVRFGSPADLHVYDFDWSPDSSRCVVTAAPGPGDNNWWIARLHVLNLANATAKEIYRPKLQIAVPQWSPDGSQIAFIEGLMSDEGFHGGEVYTVPATGGEAVNHTPGRPTSPSAARWLGPNKLLLTEWAGGGSAISTLDLASNNTETLWRGDYNVHAGGNFPNFVLAADGRTSAVVRTSFTEPPEVWAGNIGDWQPLTRANAGMSSSWGTAKSVEWTNDGFHVQGWLLPPKNVQPGRNYPLAVMIHGGPSNSSTPSWPAESPLPALLAARGYFVLAPNPRGSYGQGEAFTKANVKDFGAGDLRDIMTGVDAVIAQYPVDPQRMGVFGWSYGGYMTMWTVTQTNRFKAAVAGAGIANWLSYYGENLIDQWMPPFFGATVYDDPAVYAKSSPITFIKQVKTPTLVVVGERDAECPAPQSFEFWHALKALNVPTQLVVYPGEGHGFQKPAHRIDVQERTVAWFDKYLAPPQ